MASVLPSRESGLTDWLTDQMTDGVDGHDLKWSSSLLSLSTDDNQIDGLVLGVLRRRMRR